ncbi:hypothetical protein JOE23_002860 [Amphibacillus cookii]|nr:hypothetical protein [Amphibacillus cookii]
MSNTLKTLTVHLAKKHHLLIKQEMMLYMINDVKLYNPIHDL